MRTAVIALALLSLVLAACGDDEYKTRKAASTTPKKSKPVRVLTDEAGQEMLTFRCTKCHTTTPIRKSKKTLSQWEEQIAFCVHAGARLAPVEKASLAVWLHKTYGP
jgi:cytochrome c5